MIKTSGIEVSTKKRLAQLIEVREKATPSESTFKKFESESKNSEQREICVKSRRTGSGTKANNQSELVLDRATPTVFAWRVEPTPVGSRSSIYGRNQSIKIWRF